MEDFTVVFNGKNIKCTIERKKVKNINIRIKSDGVHISASKNIPVEYIIDVVNKKESFIVNALEKIRQEYSEYYDINKSKKISYLGQIFPIKIILGNKEQVVFDENEFRVFTSKPDNDSIRIQLKKWYLTRAVIIFREINEYTYNEFIKNGFDVPYASVTIKEMKSRWGSCNWVKGKISMNLRLMEYPPDCIYGVFFHEYTHFIHQNHSASFYNTLTHMYPAYYETDKILKNYKK